MGVGRWKAWSYRLAAGAGALLVATIVLLVWRPQIGTCESANQIKCREEAVQLAFTISLVLWVIGFIVIVAAMVLYLRHLKESRLARSGGRGAPGPAGDPTQRDARLAARPASYPPSPGPTDARKLASSKPGQGRPNGQPPARR